MDGTGAGAAQTHVYSLVAGDGSADNNFFTISGNTLRTGNNFPDGTRGSYSVRIRTTDNGPGGLFFEKTFTITINNFKPTDIALSQNSVPGAANLTVGGPDDRFLFGLEVIARGLATYVGSDEVTPDPGERSVRAPRRSRRRGGRR